MTYSEQLQHPKWLAKRKEILTRDCNKCTNCNIITDLQVHHIQYHKFAKAWEYRNEYLITLCETCHKIEHYTKVIPVLDNILPYRYNPPKIVKTLEEKREARRLKLEPREQDKIKREIRFKEHYRNQLPYDIEELNKVIIEIRKIDNITSFKTMEIWYDSFSLATNEIEDWQYSIPYELVESYFCIEANIIYANKIINQ